MKDLDMDEKSLQELANDAERYLRKTIRTLTAIERITCRMAAKGDDLAPEGNALVAEALGHALLTKGRATAAGNLMPDLAVKFGGK